MEKKILYIVNIKKYRNLDLGEPPSPGKVLQELILEAEKYNEEELISYWKQVNSWYEEK